MIRLLRAWFNRTFRRHKIDAVIEGLHFTRTGNAYEAQVTFDMPGIEIMTKMMVDAFRSTGSINYLDFSVVDQADLEVYAMSIQRQNGLRPSVINKILRDALVRIVGMDRYLLDEYLVARDALIECGYLSEDGTLA